MQNLYVLSKPTTSQIQAHQQAQRHDNNVSAVVTAEKMTKKQRRRRRKKLQKIEEKSNAEENQGGLVDGSHADLPGGNDAVNGHQNPRKAKFTVGANNLDSEAATSSKQSKKSKESGDLKGSGANKDSRRCEDRQEPEMVAWVTLDGMDLVR